jgi:hypothetical protein
LPVWPAAAPQVASIYTLYTLKPSSYICAGIGMLQPLGGRLAYLDIGKCVLVTGATLSPLAQARLYLRGLACRLHPSHSLWLR